MLFDINVFSGKFKHRKFGKIHGSLTINWIYWGYTDILALKEYPLAFQLPLRTVTTVILCDSTKAVFWG
jgi:hypothetical protein